MEDERKLSVVRRHISDEKFFYGGKVPEIYTADTLKISSVEWQTLAELPFKKLLEARRKLFASNMMVQDMIFKDQPSELVKIWLSDIGNNQPVITPIRPDYIVTGDGRVMAAEFDLLPGGCGITVGMEAKIINNPTRTLDAYASFLRQINVDENSTVVLVVPDLDDPYLYERIYLSAQLRKLGLPVYAKSLKEIDWQRLVIHDESGGERRITHVDRLYYWYEVPKDMSEADKSVILDLSSHGVIEFPSLRREYLHAKVWEALFWLPSLERFWQNELGADVFRQFREVTPKTWFLEDKKECLLGSRKHRKGLILKEGSPERINSWGSRSVIFLHKVTTSKMAEIIDACLDCSGRDGADCNMRGGVPVIPLVQEEIVSDKFSISTNRGEKTGCIRMSPFIWIDGNGFSVFSPGLSTVRDSKIVHGATDSCTIPNI